MNWLAMTLLFIQWVLCVMTITVVSANECALNSQCVPIADCPFIRDNFNLIKRKPYCNLESRGANVCCRKSSQNYTQPKYVDSRVVRECRSYDSVPSLQNPLEEGCHYTSNIVGRSKAEPKEFPFMALIHTKKGDVIAKLYGGALISKKYLLTSASAFGSSDPLTYWVRLGELDHGTNSDDALTQDIKIKNFIPHHQYYKTKLSKFHDIALIELAKEAIFNDYVRPACLSLVDDNDFRQFLFTGWGFPKREPSTHLHKMKLDRLEDAKCFDMLQRDGWEKDINNRTNICATPSTGDIGNCLGDGGSPLFANHPEFPCQFLVVGILSYGRGSAYTACGTKDDPTVYTRVKSYIDWIQPIVWD
ncbi:phenoloxidase-activating factor 3-like [Glossina fuscipes]|uniref:Phenoloxidase-activating factor 3-like n=1 Tax=Glossina fuscipes TaxID=7396 RepID=A0A9C5ZCZ2_9MUSC|nr:phenoloxidase-activating factor 3-like [Glossina fuscipes]